MKRSQTPAERIEEIRELLIEANDIKAVSRYRVAMKDLLVFQYIPYLLERVARLERENENLAYDLRQWVHEAAQKAEDALTQPPDGD